MSPLPVWWKDRDKKLAEAPTSLDNAWFERRERLWGEHAERLLDELEKYEDEHPKGAPCLIKAMDAAGAAVVGWQNRHETPTNVGSTAPARAQSVAHSHSG